MTTLAASMFSPVFASESTGHRRVATFNSGNLQVPDDSIVRLVEPLFGLGAENEYLVYRTQPGPLYWWQAVGRPDLALCALAPFEAGLDPEILIDQASAELIGASGPDDIMVFTLVVLDPDATQTRTNLRAPILVCRSTGKGVQIVLDDPKLPVKAYLADLIARKAPGA